MQGVPSQPAIGNASMASINNSIYYIGIGSFFWYYNLGAHDLFKLDLNGNIKWAKNYSLDDYGDAAYFTNLKFFHDGLYSSMPISGGIKITKFDTINGNIIYTKNVVLTNNMPWYFGKLFITELDSVNLLFNIANYLIKYDCINNTVVSVVKFDFDNNDFPIFTSAVKNSDYSLVLSCYSYSGSTGNTIKVRNNNSFDYLSGVNFGAYYQLFKKNNSRLMCFSEGSWQLSPQTTEIDSSLNAIKVMSPNQQINTVTGSFFMKNNKLFFHSNSRDFIIDTAYNCLQSREEYIPPDIAVSPYAPLFTCPNILVGNGIYSVRTSSACTMMNKTVFVRSDTNFVDPCNTSGMSLILTQTTIPTYSVITATVTPVTPTISVGTYTLINLNVGDSLYCTTSTDIASNLISKQNLLLKYRERSVDLESNDIMKEATLYDIYGRKVEKVELNGQSLEIPYSSQAPGIYFVQIFYTDNSYSRVKILLK
jgi:hypothetical protein